jgi:Flp pilus assembly protein TadG
MRRSASPSRAGNRTGHRTRRTGGTHPSNRADDRAGGTRRTGGTHPGDRAGHERGSVTIQMVILLPTVFSILFLGIQGALYYYARQVAHAAAQEGAREAGSEHGTSASGIAAANAFLGNAGGPGVMTHTRVFASRSQTTAQITVRGKSMSVIPGWTLSVRQSASVPVERVTG